MVSSWIRKFRTTTTNVPGIWREKSATMIEDSALGTLVRDVPAENGSYSFHYVFPNGTQVAVSVTPGHDPSATGNFVRSLLVHFPRQENLYRKFGAQDMCDVHRLLGPKPTLSYREIADRIKLGWIQLWDPSCNGAVIWYGAGTLLGGSRLGVSLDSRRRFSGGCLG
jgi:hypothetical protein